jgi:hypothetical protein
MIQKASELALVQITIENRSADSVMNIVRQLRQQGWVQGVDFDFAFHQRRWDEMVGDVPSHTVFKFYKEHYATFFALKYS